MNDRTKNIDLSKRLVIIYLMIHMKKVSFFSTVLKCSTRTNSGLDLLVKDSAVCHCISARTSTLKQF